ncbi:unnamed protein product [Ambrosiozyma monospora]|uniref:Unnamed protein product n=1 Tax=Ambrosiozyma monospora TaxID=43982 RepID=A0ACB5UCD3_AMBMO|nr:unnamed protein product [Ambrosiozyma monospora]
MRKVFGSNLDELTFGPLKLNKNVILTVILLINLPVLLFASPVSTLLWVSALSAVVCVGHAALMDKPPEAAYSDAV